MSTRQRMSRGAASVALVVPLLLIGLAAAAATRDVGVFDNAYDPAQVNLNAGDTVTWVWRGENPHSVTSSNGSFPDSHPGCSALTPDQCGMQGATHTVTFEQPGTYDYFCKVHGPGSMSGQVVVQPAPEPTTPPPSEEPSEEPEPEPSSEPPPPPASPSPSPSTGPSPSAAPRPTVAASPSPSASPTTSTSPSEQPSPTPVPTTQLSPFPSPSAPDDGELDEVEVALPDGDDDGPGRTLALVLGATAVIGSIGALSRWVLFAEPWDG